jgi:hypothetical protein
VQQGRRLHLGVDRHVRVSSPFRPPQHHPNSADIAAAKVNGG